MNIDLEIVELYKKGKTLSNIASLFGVSRKYVKRRVLKANVFREKVVRLTSNEEESILARFAAGDSQLEISRSTGLSQTWISRFLRRKGIFPIRPAGAKHASWKGGRQILSGYIRVLLPQDHKFFSMASKDGYVMEHRLVVANNLGRALEPNETVHHINGNREDNKIENLQLRIGKHGKGHVMRCACCGSLNIICDSI